MKINEFFRSGFFFTNKYNTIRRKKRKSEKKKDKLYRQRLLEAYFLQKQKYIKFTQKIFNGSVYDKEHFFLLFFIISQNSKSPNRRHNFVNYKHFYSNIVVVVCSYAEQQQQTVLQIMFNQLRKKKNIKKIHKKEETHRKHKIFYEFLYILYIFCCMIN